LAAKLNATYSKVATDGVEIADVADAALERMWHEEGK
jgi:hypothetical protein